MRRVSLHWFKTSDGRAATLESLLNWFLTWSLRFGYRVAAQLAGPPPDSFLAPQTRRTGLLGLDCCRVILYKRHGPLFSVLVVGHSAVAFGFPFRMQLLADGEARLELAHAGLYLVRVDGRPHVFGPVVIDFVRIVVKEKQVSKVGLLTAVDGADGRGEEAGAAGHGENGKNLAGAVSHAVAYAGGDGSLDDFLHVHWLQGGNEAGAFVELDLASDVGEVRHCVAVLHPHTRVLELLQVVEVLRKELAHDGDVVLVNGLGCLVLRDDSGVLPLMPYKKQIDSADGQGNESRNQDFLPGSHACSSPAFRAHA